MNVRALARKVLRMEARAIQALVPKIGRPFEEAVGALARCQGRVVVTGMGKPGFIGRKIAATFASTGTPSLFLHPAEALHGDLGMVTEKDVVLAISNSGETEEITRLIAGVKKIGAGLIAMTGERTSTLARSSDVVLEIKIRREACPHNLAPTVSTTAALALGDALALALAERKGFRAERFAFLHPGGNLGKKLLRVEDVMRSGPSHAKVSPKDTVRKAILKITQARAGSCSVVGKGGRLVGIFTDGDLRRWLRQNGEDLLSRPVGEVATRKPLTVRENQLAAEALHLLKSRRIDELPVVDGGGRVVGLLDVQDLLKAGLV